MHKFNNGSVSSSNSSSSSSSSNSSCSSSSRLIDSIGLFNFSPVTKSKSFYL